MSEAKQFIQAVASNMVEVYKPLAAIREVLADEEALADMGANEDTQQLIDDAYALVSEWIDAGFSTLDQVA